MSKTPEQIYSDLVEQYPQKGFDHCIFAVAVDLPFKTWDKLPEQEKTEARLQELIQQSSLCLTALTTGLSGKERSIKVIEKGLADFGEEAFIALLSDMLYRLQQIRTPWSR